MIKRILTFLFVIIYTNLQASQWQHYQSSVTNIVDYQIQKDLILVGVILLPLSFAIDDAVQDFAVEQGFFSDEISNVGDVYGHRLGYFAVVGGMLTFDAISQRPLNRSLAEVRLVVEGVLAGQLVIEMLKTITNRERPNGKSHRSFPSGHAGGAFGLATTLQEIYGNKIGIPAYLMAGFVGLSRINDNKHYLSDVVAGGLIGTAVARGFTKNFENNWQIVPNINSSEKSVTLNYYF